MTTIEKTNLIIQEAYHSNQEKYQTTSPIPSESIISTNLGGYDDSTNEISFESQKTSKGSKLKISYSERLVSLNINNNVITWIDEKINSVNRKPGKITDEHLFTLIYLGHLVLGIDCDPLGLASLLSINIPKSKVSQMISGIYGIDSCISELSITVMIIVLLPKDYIREIVIFLYNNNRINCNMNDLIFSIEFFIERLCKENKYLVQENPKNMAAAACFYYISLRNSKVKIPKSSFIDHKTDERFFNKCYLELKKTFEKVAVQNPEKINNFFI